MNTKAKLILAAVIGIILFVALDGPEHTRKALNPVGYWTEKRDKSQEMVMFYQNDMRYCQLELEKLNRTRDITIRQSILAGSTPQEARDEFLADWEVMKEECSFTRELLAMTQADLEEENRELAKHE